MSTIKEDSIRGVKWAAIEKFSVQAVQFVLGIIMARLLSPDDYGTLGMLAIFIAISQTFVDSGFSAALIRKLDRTSRDYSTVFWFNIAIALVCYLILYLCAPLIAGFFNIEILKPVLRVHAITLIINSLFSVQMTKLTAEINFKAIAKSSLAAAVVSGGVGIWMAWKGYGIWSLVGQSICSSLVNLVLIPLSAKWMPKLVFSKKSFRELFGFGSNILGASLIDTFVSNINTLIIGKFFSPASLGYYTRGTQFAKLPVDSINGVLSKVTYPVFSKIQDDDTRLADVYGKYIRLTSMCIFFACCLLSALARPLINLILTEKWAEAAVYLQIFSFAIMFDHINSINVNLIKVKGRSDLLLKIEVFKKSISLLLLFAAIPFGVIGICLSRVLYSQVAIVFNTYYNGKLLGMGYREQFRLYSKYFLLSLICCLPALALVLFAGLPDWASLILGTILSSLFYIITVRKDIRELLINSFRN